MSDLTTMDEVELVCNHCNASFDADADGNPYDCQIRMQEHPETRVICGIPSYSEPDDLDDWLADKDDADLAGNFRSTHTSLLTLLETHGSGAEKSFTWEPELINRMVFAQAISALEAFLADASLLHVMKSPEAAARLMEHDKVLRETRLSLIEIAKDPGLPMDRVKGRLKGILYHNLSAVDHLFFTAFGIRIFEHDDKETRAALFQAIKYRHDCVHRNGRDIEGNVLTVFTNAYVQDVLGQLLALVNRIEQALKAYEAARSDF